MNIIIKFCLLFVKPKIEDNENYRFECKSLFGTHHMTKFVDKKFEKHLKDFFDNQLKEINN